MQRRFTIAPALTLGLIAGAAIGQPVTITTNTTIGPATTTIGNPPVPLATAQITVAGATLTIDRTDTVNIASLQLVVNGGTGSTLTHTQGTRIDIVTTGNVLVDANSVITADSKGLGGGTGPGTGQTVNGFSGGGAAYGGAGGDGGGSSQSITTLTGLGGNCYAFDQASLFGPTALGSGGGPAWVNGVRDNTSAGAGGGAIRLTVGGTLTLNGLISASGGDGSYRGGTTDRSGGGGSGGSIFITTNAIAGTGSINASGGAGVSGEASFRNSGGGGGGRVAIITNSPNLDEITSPDVTGGTGWNRGGAGTFYRRLGGEARGTIFIDGNNASVGDNTEFYGPLTLDANLVIQNNGRLGSTNRLTDTDTNTFDLTVLGNVTVAGGVSPGAINADACGRRADSGAGAGVSLEGFSAGGGGYGGRGGNGGNFANSGGATYGEPYSLLLGSGGGSAWVNAVQDRTSGGRGGGTLKLQVNGTLRVDGLISARGGAGAYRGGTTDRSGGGGSGGSIFVAANALTGTGSINAGGGPGVSGEASFRNSGGGGGGRVVVVTCTPATPTVVVAGGTGSATGQPGTSVVRTSGFVQQPTLSGSTCLGETISYQVSAVGVGPLTYRWRKGSVPINTTTNPSAATATLTLTNLQGTDSGVYDCVVTSACGNVTSTSVNVNVTACCDDIDFNNNNVFPEDADVIEFFNVLAGAECPTCNDIDFNNNAVFPEDQDVIDFFNVLAGGACP